MKKPLAAVVLLAGCGGAEPPGAESSPETPAVFVVNYPLKYFADRIGGGVVDIRFPAPSGVDPAFWAPDPETIVAYQGADLILLNGAGYARWTERASLPLSKLVDTSASFRDRYLEIEEAVVHTHGPEGGHAHEGTAFTTWLDPLLPIEQARAIVDAFADRWPEHSAEFQAGFEALERDLRDLDDEMSRAVSGGAGPLVASHAVYQYLARRYDLDLVSVHWEPDEPPDEAMWQELERILEDHPARIMIWEGEPIESSAERLATLGVASVVFDPCGNAPEHGDYLEVMRSNIDRLRSAAP